MNEVYIALGSNLGDRLKNIHDAKEMLAGRIEGLRLSQIYETQAEGMETGHFHPFMNAVIYGRTHLDARSLLDFLLESELKLGRVRTSEKGHLSRTIDLDLLMFNSVISVDNDLELPHPRLHTRLFVLKPLMDLNPDLEIPGINKKVKHLYQDLIAINS
jgi:2-amino-4-hydroxy-6-hydroxymethyldihydropteridine diphosphokinase